eukprot:2600846-Prymnesium_polylepis.1
MHALGMYPGTCQSQLPCVEPQNVHNDKATEAAAPSFSLLSHGVESRIMPSATSRPSLPLCMLQPPTVQLSVAAGGVPSTGGSAQRPTLPCRGCASQLPVLALTHRPVLALSILPGG